MPEKLSEQTRAKISKFCAELAANHALDPDTRDEICGHLEDKLAAYVSGEVRPTEEDALVLARAHFGDADRVSRTLSGLAAQADRRLAGRKRMIRKLAIALTLLTIVCVPPGVLGMTVAERDNFSRFISVASDPGGPGVLLRLLLFFAIAEAGVLSAVRVNLRKTWQRMTAAASIIPATVAHYQIAMAGWGVRLAAQLVNECVSPAGSFVLLTALICLVGHVWLIALLLVPPAPPAFDQLSLPART